MTSCSRSRLQPASGPCKVLICCRVEQAFIWDLSIPDRGPRNMVTFNRKPETLHERPLSGLRRFYKRPPVLGSGDRLVLQTGRLNRLYVLQSKKLFLHCRQGSNIAET